MDTNLTNFISLQFFNQFQLLQAKFNSLIEESKTRYNARLSHKLLDPKIRPFSEQ